MAAPPVRPALSSALQEARARSLELQADLEDDQLQVPYLPTINPILWELGHAAYFQEYWVLREGLGRSSLLSGSEELFDSICIDHEQRWRLPMPSRAAVLDYMEGVRDQVLEALEAGQLESRELHRLEFSLYHEDMHAESLTATRQALGLPAPRLGVAQVPEPEGMGYLTEREVSGGVVRMGSLPEEGFSFDNERGAHDVEVAPFRIACSAVTEGEFRDFVEDGGYRRPELWTPKGWAWRLAVQAEQPLYWRRAADGSFERRHFDRWLALDPERAMIHVSWYEASAFASWAGRRLPSEAEWELAAQGAAGEGGNLDWRAGGPAHVRAFSHGRSESGCHQMLGNVWEWTATTFGPYPGFEPDMYHQFSQASFHTRKVLRGGCWASRTRFARTRLRNFYQPGRRDVFAGLRTCAR